ncbi:branched-chain amino acid ABC transporter permease [Bradyrhizobium tropiciagri]|uniref:branched-chain amino acid ABC transporter permease n=1 Tax=Bradyrhizobium tropiciagri TaxID=312253 RepID=UPI001BA9165B|nr:branched-chain amino acid ABC transporter permease [Bradyrhizobium tropiciagri]MBR0896705.1 branched-chain amino acid ABC transporter permease [Bradyrhizobium tropiciagri]
MSQFLQFSLAGLTVGATYALAALGYTLVYNASGMINFAQGEFIMLGAMVASALVAGGVPLLGAIALAILFTTLVGVAVAKFAVEPARTASMTSLIIITLGAGQVIRGAVEIGLGKGNHALPGLSEDRPLDVLGATLAPQALWIMGLSLVVVVALFWYFNATMHGKALIATSHNRLAAQLVGINTTGILTFSFALSATLGAIGGVLLAPITFTSYDAGTMLGLKGFVAAALGGLGSSVGAVVGGVALGVIEAMTAAYVSSAYKDAVAFVLIILLFFVAPRGLFGAKTSERV